MGSIIPLPYWQINISPSQRESACPIFLQNLSAKDISIISTPDSSYQVLTWPQVQQIITLNQIDQFQRIPSDLRRYLEYIYKIKQSHGSVMQFVLQERLLWTVPLEAKGGIFEKESDWKILKNDWPYGIDEKIVHLVVWTKFELEDDLATGLLVDHTKAAIDTFVHEKFAIKVGKENVIWFKNWKSLKSVHAVEHFHVMLYNPEPNFVEEITNGDVALCQVT